MIFAVGREDESLACFCMPVVVNPANRLAPILTSLKEHTLDALGPMMMSMNATCWACPWHSRVASIG